MKAYIIYCLVSGLFRSWVILESYGLIEGAI